MCLQVWPEVSITRGFPTYFPPLSFVLSVSAVKDGLEDYRRHVADAEENERTVLVKEKSGNFCRRMWKNVVVGDIVKLLNREQIPADIVMLKSSDENNQVYIMSANLDGETNLKQRE